MPPRPYPDSNPYLNPKPNLKSLGQKVWVSRFWGRASASIITFLTTVTILQVQQNNYFHITDDEVAKECGNITVTNNTLTAEAQTYAIDCVDGAEGNKVRVRLENTDRPLEIAEISVMGYQKISEYKVCNNLMQVFVKKNVKFLNSLIFR